MGGAHGVRFCSCQIRQTHKTFANLWHNRGLFSYQSGPCPTPNPAPTSSTHASPAQPEVFACERHGRSSSSSWGAEREREKKQCVHTTNWKNKGANKLAETKFAPIKTQQTQKLHKSKLFFLFASCERWLGSSLKAGMHDYEGKLS